jgi:hypothetical protein
MLQGKQWNIFKTRTNKSLFLIKKIAFQKMSIVIVLIEGRKYCQN